MRWRLVVLPTFLGIAATALALVTTCAPGEPDPTVDHAPPVSPTDAPRVAKSAPRPERQRAVAATPADPAPAVGSAASATPSATATTVVVRVFAREGGTVAGAAVYLHRAWQGAMGYEARIETSGTSGDDGTARFVVTPGQFFARASRDGLLGASSTVRAPHVPSDSETTFTVVLRPAVRHRGSVVVEETRDPIPGALVRVREGGLISAATTDANGRFEFANAVFEQDPVAWVEAFGCMPDSPWRERPDATTVVWSFRLRQATVVRGLLRGPDGVPASLTREFSLIVGDDLGSARIWPDGERRFEVAIAGAKGALFLRSEDYAPVRLGVEATGPGVVDAGEIRLVPGKRLRGRVLDVTGEPVANVRVDVRSLDLELGLGSARTTARGKFEINGLGDGELEVATSERVNAPLAGGRPDTTRRGVFADGADLVIQQPEGNAVLLRLRDASNAELVVREVNVHVGTKRDPLRWTTRNGRDVHTLRLLVETPGDYDIGVNAEGYETVEIPGVAFVEGRATPVDVRLTPRAK